MVGRVGDTRQFGPLAQTAVEPTTCPASLSRASLSEIPWYEGCFEVLGVRVLKRSRLFGADLEFELVSVYIPESY